MMIRLSTVAGVLFLLADSVLQGKAASSARALPQPLPSHPGNIFLANEPVVVEAPVHAAHPWRVVDYDGATVAQGQSDERGQARLGQLPVGYYELLSGSGERPNRISLGVLQPLQAATPRNSPEKAPGVTGCAKNSRVP